MVFVSLVSGSGQARLKFDIESVGVVGRADRMVASESLELLALERAVGLPDGRAPAARF